MDLSTPIRSQSALRAGSTNVDHRPPLKKGKPVLASSEKDGSPPPKGGKAWTGPRYRKRSKRRSTGEKRTGRSALARRRAARILKFVVAERESTRGQSSEEARPSKPRSEDPGKSPDLQRFTLRVATRLSRVHVAIAGGSRTPFEGQDLLRYSECITSKYASHWNMNPWRASWLSDLVRSYVMTCLVSKHYVSVPTCRVGPYLSQLARVIHRFAVASTNVGRRDQLIASIKLFCLESRRSWIDGRVNAIPYRRWFTLHGHLPTVTELLNFSFWARALPRTSMRGKKELAIADQNIRLTTPRPVSSDLSERCHDWVAEHLGEVKARRTPASAVVSRSSCLSHPRSEGGRAQATHEVLEALRAPEALPYNEALGTSRARARKMDPFELLEHETFSPLDGATEVGNSFDLRSKSMALPELGYKIRVVSRSDNLRVIGSERYRGPFLNALRKFREIRLPLAGDELEYPIRLPAAFWKAGDPVIVFSADLSSATDLLSFDILKAISKATGIPFEFISGGEVDDLVMTTGTLMGIPCSWPSLSTGHIWYIHDVVGAPYGSFVLKGDDLLAFWPLSLVNRYIDLLEASTGMALSLTKSFRSQVDGPRRGIFCEKAYTLVSTDNPFVFRFVQERTHVSVKALASNDDSWIRDAPDKHNPKTPANLGASVYLKTQIPRIGHRRASVLCNLATAKLRRKAERLEERVSLYLPLELGGLGLIPRKSGYKFDQELSSALQGYHNGIAAVVSYFSSTLWEGCKWSDMEARLGRRPMVDPSMRLASDESAFCTYDGIIFEYRADENDSEWLSQLEPYHRTIRVITERSRGVKYCSDRSLRGFFQAYAKFSTKKLRALHNNPDAPRVSWKAACLLPKRIGIRIRAGQELPKKSDLAAAWLAFCREHEIPAGQLPPFGKGGRVGPPSEDLGSADPW